MYKSRFTFKEHSALAILVVIASIALSVYHTTSYILLPPTERFLQITIVPFSLLAAIAGCEMLLKDYNLISIDGEKIEVTNIIKRKTIQLEAASVKGYYMKKWWPYMYIVDIEDRVVVRLNLELYKDYDILLSKFNLTYLGVYKKKKK